MVHIEDLIDKILPDRRSTKDILHFYLLGLVMIPIQAIQLLSKQIFVRELPVIFCIQILFPNKILMICKDQLKMRRPQTISTIFI